MKVASTDLFNAAQVATRWGRWLDFPLLRIPAALLFLAPGVAGHNLLMIFVVEKLAQPWFAICRDCLFVVESIVFILLYRWYVRRIEKRRPLEVSFDGAAGEFGTGALMSLGIVGIAVLALVAAGSYRIESLNNPWTIIHAFAVFTSGALIQVLIFRLILFRLCEELLGTWISVAVIAPIFACAHMANPNASAISFAALAGSDVLLFAGFVLTRRLWLVWGIHAGWNFFQDGLFGMPNSGVTELPSWIVPEIGGPAWLSGGTFGIEASVGGIVLPLMAGIMLFVVAARRNQIVLPRWIRNRPA